MQVVLSERLVVTRSQHVGHTSQWEHFAGQTEKKMSDGWPARGADGGTL